MKDFHIENGCLKEYIGADKEVVIPNGVTSIGKCAFFRCKSLKSVIIPDGVTSIGNYAFSDCKSLRSVVIPDSVITLKSLEHFRLYADLEKTCLATVSLKDFFI